MFSTSSIELAKDGVLGEYNWNAGGAYGGQPWQDFLPTDAAVNQFTRINALFSRWL